MWETLGIEPTTDIKAIKSAYAKLAKQYNPEEHPDEFRRIYTAYKRACVYAKAANGAHEAAVHEEKSETEKPAEKAKKADDTLLKFDFSTVDIFPDYDLPLPKRFEKMLDNIKFLLDDETRKDSLPEWYRVFQKDDFTLLADSMEFRAAADKLLADELFSPETASAIARVFGHGTRAIPYGKNRSGQERWRLWISGSSRKAPPKGYKMPSYMDTSPSKGAIYDTINDILKVIIVLIMIIFFASLPAIIKLIPKREDIPTPAETSMTTRSADMDGITFYFDENGKVIGMDKT